MAFNYLNCLQTQMSVNVALTNVMPTTASALTHLGHIVAAANKGINWM